MSTKQPPHKVGAFLDGKSFAQLERDADQAIRSGIEYWPQLYLKLARKYENLYKETAHLRQQELFTPPPFTNPNEGPVND